MLDHTIRGYGMNAQTPTEAEPWLSILVDATEPLLLLTEPGPLDLSLTLDLDIPFVTEGDPFWHLLRVLTTQWTTRAPCPLRIALGAARTITHTMTGEVVEFGYDAVGHTRVPATNAAQSHPEIHSHGIHRLRFTLTDVVLHDT